MASRVEYAVSITPVYSHTAGEGVAVDVIATDVGKSLGGSGYSSVTWGTTTGFTAGVPTYITSNGTSIAVTSAKFLYIKNTGYVYSSSSVLGASSSDYINIAVSGNTICTLRAGSAIIFPFDAAVSQTFDITNHLTNMAIEYFWTA